jgi:hypothetical protein
LDSLPLFPRGSRQYLGPERTVGHIKTYLIPVFHGKVKKIPSNIITFYSDLPRKQIHDHSYSPVGICFEKTGHKLYFTQQQRTDNSGIVFKCILLKIMVRYIKIPQVVEFPDSSLPGISVHFMPYMKDKIRTVGNATL